MNMLLLGGYKLLLKALKLGLEEEGFTVDVANVGPDGDNKVRTTSYDMLVLDLVPPLETALTLLATWRRAGLRTPVLALTPEGTDGEREGAGVTAWLPKPFGLDDLLDRVRTLAGAGRRHDNPALEMLVPAATPLSARNKVPTRVNSKSLLEVSSW